MGGIEKREGWVKGEDGKRVMEEMGKGRRSGEGRGRVKEEEGERKN